MKNPKNQSWFRNNSGFSWKIVCCQLSLLLLLWYTFCNSSWEARIPCAAQKEAEEAFVFNNLTLRDHPRILEYIKKYHLQPPSATNYSVPTNEFFPLDDLIRRPLMKKMGGRINHGFFVECGANDGKFRSNTLELEMSYGWRGLLVESSPRLFPKLQATNRNAWLSDICLSGRPEQIEFLKHKDNVTQWRSAAGKINPVGKYKNPDSGFEKFNRTHYELEGIVDCFPLSSVLKAMNISHVDFFSLDVEGHEYQVLSQIPFDEISVEVIFVEYYWTAEGKNAVADLMASKGYTMWNDTGIDFIFVKN